MSNKSEGDAHTIWMESIQAHQADMLVLEPLLQGPIKQEDEQLPVKEVVVWVEPTQPQTAYYKGIYIKEIATLSLRRCSLCCKCPCSARSAVASASPTPPPFLWPRWRW